MLFRSSSGRTPLLPSSALKGQQTLAQGRVRSRNSARRPGSRSPRVSPSPPKTSTSLKSLGERAGVRGVDPVRSRKSRFVPTDIERTTKRETRQPATNRPPLPTSPPESLGAQASCLPFAARMPALPGIRGERRNGRNTDPWRRDVAPAPRLPWAIFCRPLQGSRRKQRRPAAAHSKTSNLQYRLSAV